MIQYSSISELLRSSRSDRRPVSEDLDIFTFDELGANTQKMMPSHRRHFYTVIFMKDQKEGQVSINQTRHTKLNDTLLFQGKEHIFSFVRDAHVEGGIILFHPSFLLPHVKNIELEFPFFSISNHNYFHLNHTEKVSFEGLFDTLIRERSDVPVAKMLLLAFLEKSNQLYKTYDQEEQFLSKRVLTLRKYKNLISNHFIDNKDVSFYADHLNISSNYLNEIVKSETGRSAKSHITDRVVLEAKNLLQYSEMSISEISHTLQFSEPTHFTKFFKKETGLTPKAFQSQQP